MPLLSFFALVLLVWTLGGALSWLAMRHEGLEGSWPFHLGGCGVWTLLAIGTIWGAFRVDQAILGGLAFAVATILAGPFLFRSTWFLFDRTRRWYVGTDSLPPLYSHDQAEAFERRRQWDQAVRLYKEAVASDPGDVVARLRISEIEAGRDRHEEAISWARSALPFLAGRERLTAVFRIADLHGAAGEPEKARRALTECLAQETDERLRGYAQRRLDGMPKS